MVDIHPTCIDCALNACGKPGMELPAFCPTRDFDLQELPELTALMEDEQNSRMIKSAAHSSHVSYRQKNSRLQETIMFAQGYGAKKIGIAACISLAAESRTAAKAFRESGFEVVGAICKIGRVTCDQVDVPLEARSPQTALCNPIYQAQVLNAQHTDLNVVVGLCAGHDALFMKHAKAPCTVLAVKDFKYDHHSVRALRDN